MPQLTPADLIPYDPFDGMRFGPQTCFLSGQPVGPDDTIPVFAEWLQARYNLADRPIQLLDQRTVLMRDLRLPASPAVRARIEALEQQVETASAQGPEALRALGDETLFLWMGKMFYGVFITELLNEFEPLIKPKYPLAENAALVRRFQAFFQLLQGLRVPTEYADFVPGSVFVLEADPAEDVTPFEYDDDLNTLVFSIKLNKTVLVACLVDIGLIGQAMGKVYHDAQRPLHPVQIAEFKARVYYAAHLLHVVPDIYPRTPRPGDTQLVFDALLDDVTGAVFNPWENASYTQTLADMWYRWNISLADIVEKPLEPMSLLYDETGKPRQLKHWPATI
ncbi:hypothetical protein Q3A66_00505 [Hymenobacter sp. BT770]|uniref:hypothetical protein n=1 Tax=Hymenobacter sp. BT770 TaxID=2886942 RepID=UPI001D12029F|nr:hypothetical protein [Hymenobacter sp. BT770]MCC3151850.1 hypothetical protein [Hymenobacter sp. BT770]MDO3413528.1 hypothetical protein [Hymenobacter sp. BT770]